LPEKALRLEDSEMITVSPETMFDFRPTVGDDWDVIVVGGGPAGSSTAALVAEHGYRVLLLERARLPRFHVGESLIPETYWQLKRLGLLEKMKQSSFPRKYSVQFVSDGSKESAPFYFDDNNPHESSVTWQVVRSEFDRMIMDRATELGATVHSSAQVTDVRYEDGVAVGVNCRLTDEDGNKVDRSLSCRVVVDATGQSAFISNRRKDREPDPLLKKGTIWTYFQGAHRGPGKDEGATIIMQTEDKKSWFWYIPLPDDIVSVGCTGSMDYMFGGSYSNAESVFQRELDRCPAMTKRLSAATRTTDFFTTKDFSYYSGQGAGDGWVLVGDAFGFIDPVYSSGVFLALKSGELAADAIHDALQRDDVSGPRLGQWQPMFKNGIENFRKLVYAFYAPNFSFGSFMKQHPEFRSNLVDILVGDVFKPGVGDMFETMGLIEPPVDSPEFADSVA